MANPDNPSGFQVVRSRTGIADMVKGTTASNVTLADGDFIIMLTTGLISIALATSASLHGLCAKPVTGAAGVQKEVWYYPATDALEFEGQCSGTMAQTDIGELVDIEGTTGIMEVNEDSNTYGVLKVTGLGNGLKNAVGANARVRVVVAKSSYTGKNGTL